MIDMTFRFLRPFYDIPVLRTSRSENPRQSEFVMLGRGNGLALGLSLTLLHICHLDFALLLQITIHIHLGRCAARLAFEICAWLLCLGKRACETVDVVALFVDNLRLGLVLCLE